MNSDNTAIMQPNELINSVIQGSANTAELLRQQSTTLALLSGTMTMSLGVNTGFLTSVLGELALQNNFLDGQLGQQQLYDASALEGAAAMNLLVNTLSGNVKGIVESLAIISALGHTISENVGKYLPMIEKMGGGASNGLGTAFAGISAVTGVIAIAGGLGAILPVLAAILPALAVFATAIGVFAVLAGGASMWVDHTYGGEQSQSTSIPKNDSQNKKQTTNPIPSQDQVQPWSQAQPTMQNIPTGTTQIIDSAQAAIDPFNTGKGEDSAYNKYQGQMESSQKTADALREAVKTGNTDVVAQLGAVADALQRLAEKPADRNVKSEIVINTLKTNATLSEFKDMFNETLLRDLETVE